MERQLMLQTPEKYITQDITLTYPCFFCSFPSGGFTGLDLGMETVITMIRFIPALQPLTIILGGKFQGSNLSPVEGYEDIYTITKTPHIGWNEILLSHPRSYRFVRYIGPPESHCQISRIEYYTGSTSAGEVRKLTGHPFSNDPAPEPGREFDMVYREGPAATISFKDFAKNTGAPIYIHSHHLQQHDVIFFHQHDFVEITYILNGSCFHLSHHALNFLSAGSLMMISPGVMHACIGANNLSYIDFLFYPDLFWPRHQEDFAHLKEIGRFFYRKPESNPDDMPIVTKLNPEQQEESLPFLQTLNVNFYNRPPGYLLSGYGIFLHWLVLVDRFFQSEDFLQTSGTQPNALVASVIRHLEQHHAVINNLEEVASHCNISYSRLAHLFKIETGVSLFDYLNRIRIENACHRLLHTRENLTDIAFAVGFSNYDGFSRIFKQHLGCSPKEFRTVWGGWFR